ncbi:hypothetical protein ILUMI_26094 [Ignelater luminosus]|uniref:Uncharacterized protein n=1 Tax=Ignelater luminosus TaxID=2038154 RepID=A0A8K0C756_IGNLU|nr:hypothetical protein ILUMI_26094 [Ignelater luminosus]
MGKLEEMLVFKKKWQLWRKEENNKLRKENKKIEQQIKKQDKRIELLEKEVRKKKTIIQKIEDERKKIRITLREIDVQIDIEKEMCERLIQIELLSWNIQMEIIRAAKKPKESKMKRSEFAKMAEFYEELQDTLDNIRGVSSKIIIIQDWNSRIGDDISGGMGCRTARTQEMNISGSDNMNVNKLTHMS